MVCLRPVALLALALPCCEAGPQLPPAAVIAEDVRISSVAADDGHYYWTASVGGEANHTGRLMRLARGTGSPETLADRLFNPGAILIEEGAIFWGLYADIASCGSCPMTLDPDATARYVCSGVPQCHLLPVAVIDGMLVAVGQGDGGSVFVAIDLETEAAAELAAVGGYGYVSEWDVAGETAYVIVGDGSSGTLAKLDLRGGSITSLASGIRHPHGLVVAADSVYWVDGNYLQMPTQVFRLPLDRLGGPELVAEVGPDLYVSSSVLVGDGIWLAGSGGTDEAPTGSLIRVGIEDGAVVRYPVDYVPYLIRADGDGLIVLTESDRTDGGVPGRMRILSQRLR